MNSVPLNLTVRIGLSHCVRHIRPHADPDGAAAPVWTEGRWLLQESLSFTPYLPSDEFTDAHGNTTYRSILQPGQKHHSSRMRWLPSPPSRDNYDHQANPLPIDQLPPWVIRYNAAQSLLRHRQAAQFRVAAFRPFPAGARPNLRDLQLGPPQHSVPLWRRSRGYFRLGRDQPALRRLPRFCPRGHRALPRLQFAGALRGGASTRYWGTRTPVRRWIFTPISRSTWDRPGARSMPGTTSRASAASKSRRGLDAVDGAFSTIYGQANLSWFEVWAYQVDPNHVSVGDPIDMSKRLDGTAQIRFN